jgi:hypothetical protein
MQQNPLIRQPITGGKTVAVTGTTTGNRRMPIASNSKNNLGASHNPTGVPTAAVASPNSLRSR